VQKASPAVLGRPASPQITRERNPDPNGRPLDGAVVRDPEGGVIGGSAKYHVEFSAPDSSSAGEVTRSELGRQLSVSVSVQTERDEEHVDVRARLEEMQAQLDDLLLSRGQHIVQYERELAGVRAKHESELEAVRSRLADAEKEWTSLDELVVSHDQQVGQLGKELIDVRAKLETKESELEAFRLRLTDAENLLTKGDGKADKFRAQYTTDSMNTDEDQVTRGLMERMEAIEDEIARGSKRWNEKSIEEMVCRNEG
jgi:chromosome segregation ATPase